MLLMAGIAWCLALGLVIALCKCAQRADELERELQERDDDWSGFDAGRLQSVPDALVIDLHDARIAR